ncbi:unnamed protein product [Coffea canephora]|uniref:PWWP domain-containing protein n=1 Tax=Coffea canephora TaxID=49390 RepID=A0A068UDV5_COFCA|nr:unnamed protein product [Coffea canephora]
MILGFLDIFFDIELHRLKPRGRSIEGNNENKLDMSPVDDTPLSNPAGDPGEFSVTGVRDFGKVNGSSVTYGFEGLNAEMEGLKRDKSLEVETEGNNREPEPNEGYSWKGGVCGQETVKTDGKLDVQLKGTDNNEVKDKIEPDHNEEMGVCEFPQYGDSGNRKSFFVDLNSHHQEGIFIQGAESTTALIEGSLPFSVGLAEVTDATIKNGVSARNRQAPIKEVITSGPFNEVDGKDAKPCILIPKSRGEGNQMEKESEFYVSDLVWGKVRSHPWWPGQIIEPSAASEKEMKYFKKDSYLIAYFGDQTFAWNEASKIKTFQMYFSQMKKQSNATAFCNAVNSALTEVSNRVEFGLACRCLPEEVSAKVKSQVVLKSGIWEKSIRTYAGDSFSTAAAFSPAKLVNSLEALAKSPHNDIDDLEFVIARAQLLAFNRWKGYYQLPVFEELNGFLGNDLDLAAVQDEKNLVEVIDDGLGSEEDNEIECGKKMSPLHGVSCRGMDLPLNNERKTKKKKHLQDLMSGSSLSFRDGGYEDEGKASSDKASVSSGKKRKALGSTSSESTKRMRKRVSMQSARTATSLLRNYVEVGDSMHGLAGKLHSASTLTTEKSCRRPPPCEYPSMREIFSELCLAAENPVKGYSSLTTIAGFFCDFRNSICMEHNNLKKRTKSSGKQIVKKSADVEAAEAFEFEGMEDSYWTDRIIQSNLDDQVLFEPEPPSEKDVVVAEQEGLEGTNPNLDNQLEMNPVVTELGAEDPVRSYPVDEKSYEN